MEMKFHKKGRTLLVSLEGEIDHHNCEKLRMETERALEKSNAKNILFDMEAVSFMDSSGIGMLIGRYKVAQVLGGKVAVLKANKRISQIFQMSGIHALIPIFADIEHALEYTEGGKK